MTSLLTDLPACAGGLLMSEHTLAPILCLPAAGLAEAEEQLRTGLTTNGGGGAPVSALRILNLFLQRLGCDFQVFVANGRTAVPASTAQHQMPCLNVSNALSVDTALITLMART